MYNTGFSFLKSRVSPQLRSSFSKAFSRGHKKSKGGGVGGSVSDMEGLERGGESSTPSSPQLHRASGSGDAVSDAECQSTIRSVTTTFFLFLNTIEKRFFLSEEVKHV